MTPDAGYLRHLYDIILSRKGAPPQESYVAKLFAKGRKKIAQKVGEEGVETAMAAVSESREALIEESADLLFHMLVLWAETGIDPEDVLYAMRERESISGLTEKAGRKEG